MCDLIVVEDDIFWLIKVRESVGELILVLTISCLLCISHIQFLMELI